MRSKPKNILLLISTTLFCLLILELILQYSSLNSLPNSKIDPFSYYNFIKSNWNEDNIYHECSYHPIMGYTPLANLSHQEKPNPLLITNSFGHRNKNDPVNSSKIRVLTIGDSYTYGLGVKYNETFSARLDKIDDNLEVFNGGVTAYGLDQIFLKLQHIDMKINPDIIILGFFNDDIFRNMYDFFYYPKPKFKISNNKLRLTNVPVPLFKKDEKHPTSFTKYYTSMIMNHIFRDYYLQKNKKVSKLILDEIFEISKNINSTLIILYIPESNEIINNISTHHPLYNYICNMTYCLDPTEKLHDQIVKTDQETPFQCNGHYCESLHKIMGEELYKFIKKIKPKI